MKKIDICVVVGSCNKNSTTKFLAEEIVNRYKKITNNQVEVNYFFGNELSVSDCIGCTNCFIKGYCSLDAKDDMERIKKALMNTDVIIFGSPVYFHSVSGIMKRVIDRLSYWTHSMELTGKQGITIATSGGNGLSYVTEYLHKFYNYLGVQHIAKLEAPTYSMEYVEKNNVLSALDDQINNCVEALLAYVDDGQQIQCDDFQCKIFDNYKKKNEKLKEYKEEIAEIGNWFKKGFDKCKNFEEAVNKRKKEKQIC